MELHVVSSAGAACAAIADELQGAFYGVVAGVGVFGFVVLPAAHEAQGAAIAVGIFCSGDLGDVIALGGADVGDQVGHGFVEFADGHVGVGDEDVRVVVFCAPEAVDFVVVVNGGLEDFVVGAVYVAFVELSIVIYKDADLVCGIIFTTGSYYIDVGVFEDFPVVCVHTVSVYSGFFEALLPAGSTIDPGAIAVLDIILPAIGSSIVANDTTGEHGDVHVFDACAGQGLGANGGVYGVGIEKAVTGFAGISLIGHDFVVYSWVISANGPIAVASHQSSSIAIADVDVDLGVIVRIGKGLFVIGVRCIIICKLSR